MDEVNMLIGAVCGLLVWCIIFGCLGAWIAKQCGRDSGEGCLLGIFLGPLGLLIEAMLPKGKGK